MPDHFSDELKQRDRDAMEALRAHPDWNLIAHPRGGRCVMQGSRQLSRSLDPADAVLWAVEEARNCHSG